MKEQIIGRNIKKLRLKHNITQQQLADSLGISFQAVSKWETGIALPDVLMLPEIANYFEVTIDELFQTDLIAYRHKADRYMAIYESDISNLEAFEIANREYIKLFEFGKYDDEDLGYYAYLNECHARFFRERAEAYYKQAIELGSQHKKESYYKNQRQYILFRSRIGRVQECITEYKELIINEPNNPMNYSSLIEAYKCTGDFANALQIAEQGLSAFPDDAILLCYAGDTYIKLGQNENAINCWNKAYALNDELIDTRYSLASYYIQSNRKDEAKKVLEEILTWNNQRGFEIENKWVEKEIEKLV